MLSFNLSDALTKLATRQLPLGETIFLRGLLAAAIMSTVVVATGAWREARRVRDPMLALRIVGEIGSTLFYLTALVRIPLPSISAIFQVTPLAMTAAAAVFLGERVGVRRWVAVAVGLVGVLVIVRPGLDGFQPLSGLVILAVAFVVVRDISTARIDATLPASLVSVVTTACVSFLGLAMLPFESLVSLHTAWTWPTMAQIWLLSAAAGSLMSGYVFLILATRLADTSAIAPFRYVLLVWAFLFGLVLFGDLPDVATLVGAAIVVTTGLYAFNCERRDRHAVQADRRCVE